MGNHGRPGVIVNKSLSIRSNVLTILMTVGLLIIWLTYLFTEYRLLVAPIGIGLGWLMGCRIGDELNEISRKRTCAKFMREYMDKVNQ